MNIHNTNDGISAGSSRLYTVRLRHNLRLWQDRRLFGFVEDTAMLTDFVNAALANNPVKSAAKICELGSGSGGALLILAATTPHADCTGIEIMPANVELARRSLLLNAHVPGLLHRCRFIRGDLRQISHYLPPASFDIILSNPPWQPITSGRISPNPERAAARSEIFCTLADVISTAAFLLHPGGDFFLILPESRAAEADTLLYDAGFTITKRIKNTGRILWQARKS